MPTTIKTAGIRYFFQSMSRFSQLMQKGQRKVNYRQRQGRLLMTLSDEQHKAIARLIQQWLDDGTDQPAASSANKKRHR